MKNTLAKLLQPMKRRGHLRLFAHTFLFGLIPSLALADPVNIRNYSELVVHGTTEFSQGGSTDTSPIDETKPFVAPPDSTTGSLAYQLEDNFEDEGAYHDFLFRGVGFAEQEFGDPGNSKTQSLMFFTFEVTSEHLYHFSDEMGYGLPRVEATGAGPLAGEDPGAKILLAKGEYTAFGDVLALSDDAVVYERFEEPFYRGRGSRGTPSGILPPGKYTLIGWAQTILKGTMRGAFAFDLSLAEVAAGPRPAFFILEDSRRVRSAFLSEGVCALPSDDDTFLWRDEAVAYPYSIFLREVQGSGFFGEGSQPQASMANQCSALTTVRPGLYQIAGKGHAESDYNGPDGDICATSTIEVSF